MRKLLQSKVVRGVLILVVVVAIAAGWFFAQLPKPGPSRIELNEKALGVYARASYTWIICSHHGAILIDAGMNREGTEIVHALEERGLTADKVHTVLLTHGHRDHWAGVRAFPQARLIIAPEDAAMIRGEYQPKGILPRLFTMVSPPLDPPANIIEEISGNDAMTIDGEVFQIIGIPGHTRGSVGYLWKDILFCGDSLQNEDGGIGASPAIFCDDSAQNLQSLHTLLEYDFSRAADGHTGVIENAKEKLEAFLAE